MSVRVGAISMIVGVTLAAGLLLTPRKVGAHCDTLDGPVVTAARAALQKAELAPVLKWIKKEFEPEVREVFEKTLRVRATGPEARELADRYFFETVVRLHRAGEGEPYSGLAPAGTQLPAAVVAADQALQSGRVDELVTLITDSVAAGIRERFKHAQETRRQAEDSVEAGREYAAAYVEFVHYVERLHALAQGQQPSHDAAFKGPAQHHHTGGN